jgi:hypothetical protein
MYTVYVNNSDDPEYPLLMSKRRKFSKTSLLFGIRKKKQKKVTWSCEKDILSSDLTSSRSRHLSTLAINAAASSGSRLLLSIFRTVAAASFGSRLLLSIFRRAVPAASSGSRLLLSFFCRVPAASSGSGFPPSTFSKESDPPGSRSLLLSLSDFLSEILKV